MTDDRKLSKEDYIEWRDHVVTKNLVAFLRDVRKNTAENMVSEQIIMHDQCQRLMAKSLGVLEGIDLILNMSSDFEDDVDFEEDTVD